jgi:hypothetical protein
MASLSFLLGLVPSTEKVETADDKIRADFQAYKEYESSEELKHFLELEKEVKSSAFVVRKKKAKKKKADYLESEEYQKQTEYDVLKKSDKAGLVFQDQKEIPFQGD